MAELRKYGVQTTFSFPLLDRGQADYEDTPVVHAAGDTEIEQDEGGFGNTTNAFAHRGGGIYSIVLTAAEMQAARIIVKIVDQTAPKEWEDQAVSINTYGHPSAQHAFDLDSPTVSAGGANLYVTKTGNDANDGLSWPQAKLTIDAARAASANGDTINIGPGTFTEAVDASATELNFIGSGSSTILTQAVGATTLLLDSNSSVRDMAVTNTYAVVATRSAIRADGKDNLLIECVVVTSVDIGIKLSSCQNARVRDLAVFASQIGIDHLNNNSIDTLLIERCLVHVTGWVTCNCHAIYSNGNCRITDCTLVAESSAAGAFYADGVDVVNGRVEVYDTHIEADGGATASAYGVYAGALADGASVINCDITTTVVGGTAYDLRNSSADILAVGMTRYDRTKTSGTITVIEVSLIDDAISSSKIATDAIDAAALKTDAVNEIRNAVTGGAYALDTDANGRIRIVDGAGAGELNTASGKVDVNDKTGFSLSSPQTFNLTGNITGNLSGNVGGNVTGTIGGLTAAALKDFFDTDSGSNFAGAVSGSVVKEIATSPTGSGAIAFTVTVNDGGGSPIAGVEVWITTDAPGSNVIAGALTTNGSGQAVFYLDNGSYYLWKQLRGYDFTNPEAITVS